MLLSSNECALRIYKSWKFDTEINLHPKITEFFDISIDLLIPSYFYYDVLVTPIRMLENIANPFSASKEDAASYFASYESEEGTKFIQSSYISPDLRVSAPVSSVLHKPHAKFDSVIAVSAMETLLNTDNKYVALSMLGLDHFEKLEILRAGWSHIICSTDSSTVPESKEEIVSLFGTENVVVNDIMASVSAMEQSVKERRVHYAYTIFYCPIDSEYYFRFYVTTVGCVEINDELVASQFTANSTGAIDIAITLEKGYHSIALWKYYDGSNVQDYLRCQFRTAEEDPWVDFNVTNAIAQGMTVGTLLVNVNDIPDDHFESMSVFDDVSFDSLLLRQYQPISILARQNSSLLQKELSQMYFHYVPDILETSDVLEGDPQNLLTPYTHPDVYPGIVLDVVISRSSYIRYKYLDSIKLTRFELVERAGYENVDYDDMQCFSFFVEIKDQYNTFIPSAALGDLISLDDSKNVSHVTTVPGASSIEVFKISRTERTVVVFKNTIQCLEVTVKNPVVQGNEWGNITSMRVYGELLELANFVDGKGDFYRVTDIGESELKTIEYDEIGFVPSIFNPQYLPKDLQYGGEYLMFCLSVLGQIPPIEVFGNTFTLVNSQTNPFVDKSVMISNVQMTLPDDRLFDLFVDKEGLEQAPFAYVGIDMNTEGLVATDYTSFTVQVTNTSLSPYTNCLIDVKVPNVGHGYSAVDEGMNVVKVGGVQTSGSLTSDPIAWDGDTVRMVVPSIAAGDTETITFSQSISFNNPGDITGSAVTDYRAASDLVSLPVIVSKVDLVQPGSAVNRYALKRSEPPTLLGGSYSLPSKFMFGAFLVVEQSGSERVDLEVDLDVSEVLSLFGRKPMVVYSHTHRSNLDTVGINQDGSLTDDYLAWDGSKITVRIPTIKGGDSLYLLVRSGTFTGDPLSFGYEVEHDMTHNFHFSGNFVNSVTGTYAAVSNVLLTSDKYLSYQKAASFLPASFVRFSGDTTLTDWSISFWISGTHVNQGVFCSCPNLSPSSNANNGIKVAIDANGYLTFQKKHGQTVYTTTGKSVADSNWYHVVITMSSVNGLTIYIDEAVALTVPSMTTRTEVNSYFHLGWCDSYYEGDLDEFRIYTKVLTPSEVTLVKNIFDGTKRNIAAYYTSEKEVLAPTNQITSLPDLSSLQGTPLVLYKYLGIDETILRWIS